MSGLMPLSLNGISIWGHKIERTPFWPCLLENLSPMTGFLGNLRVTPSASFASFDPFPLDVPDKLRRLDRQTRMRVRWCSESECAGEDESEYNHSDVFYDDGEDAILMNREPSPGILPDRLNASPLSLFMLAGISLTHPIIGEAVQRVSLIYP